VGEQEREGEIEESESQFVERQMTIYAVGEKVRNLIQMDFFILLLLFDSLQLQFHRVYPATASCFQSPPPSKHNKLLCSALVWSLEDKYFVLNIFSRHTHV